MNSDRPVITVGLLWHSFSSDNLGVGALSESQLAICRTAATAANVELQFVVFGTIGDRNYAPPGIPIEVGRPLSLKQLITGRSGFLVDMERCDIVLDIGEGDSFTDIYGMRRFRWQIVSKIAALIKKKPLILSPQTIGPFDRFYTRWLATWTMRACRRVYARDGMSADYLRRLGLSDNIDEAIDVAFRLPYTAPPARRPGPCRIGINVSGLLFSGGYDGTNQFGLTVDYPRLIRGLLEEWTTDDANEVWLVPHVLSDRMPKDDDRVAIRGLLGEFPKARAAPEFGSPSEAKSFIATLDFLTGARMHACIAAFSAFVPVVPLAYSRKFNGLFASLGYRWLADGKAMSTQQAHDAIIDGFEQRVNVGLDVRTCMDMIESRLIGYERYLAQQFAELAKLSGRSSGKSPVST